MSRPLKSRKAHGPRCRVGGLANHAFRLVPTPSHDKLDVAGVLEPFWRLPEELRTLLIRDDRSTTQSGRPA